MYEDFFGFEERPFPSAPRVNLYFPASSAENAHQTLTRCIGRAEGPGLLIGGAGTGKSLLCHLLAARFRDAFHVVMLTSARLCTRRALLQSILFELGLPYRGLEEGELRLSLIDFLKLDESDREGVLLLVDEAHTLPLRLVEEIRMITNSLYEGQPCVRPVLAGGPALEERLANPRLESLNQRVAARCYLQPLNYEETFEYIRSQIFTVGGDPAKVFTEDAHAAVHQATDGVPRLVNQLCDHALVLAVVNERRQVDARLIEEAWSDLQQLPAPCQGPSTEASGDEGVIEFGTLDEPEFEEPNEEGFAAAEPAAEPESVSGAYDDLPMPSTQEDCGEPTCPEAHPTTESEASCNLNSDEIDLTRQLYDIETCMAQVEEEVEATPELEQDEDSASNVLSDEEAASDVEMPVEPIDELQSAVEPAEEPSLPQTTNPFEESFDDEEIVVDHYSHLHTASRSVVTAASGNQDRELAAAAEAIFQGAEHQPPPVEDWNDESAAVEPAEKADAQIIEEPTFNELIVQADREFEDTAPDTQETDDQDHDTDGAVCEMDDLDEPVSVRASVMRVPPPDDSDLIVVVDEDIASGQASGDLGAHRQDYRRLFSKLRQT